MFKNLFLLTVSCIMLFSCQNASEKKVGNNEVINSFLSINNSIIDDSLKPYHDPSIYRGVNSNFTRLDIISNRTGDPDLKIIINNNSISLHKETALGPIRRNYYFISFNSNLQLFLINILPNSDFNTSKIVIFKKDNDIWNEETENILPSINLADFWFEDRTFETNKLYDEYCYIEYNITKDKSSIEAIFNVDDYSFMNFASKDDGILANNLFNMKYNKLIFTWNITNNKYEITKKELFTNKINYIEN